jgi:hypothetical protein
MLVRLMSKLASHIFILKKYIFLLPDNRFLKRMLGVWGSSKTNALQRERMSPCTILHISTAMIICGK